MAGSNNPLVTAIIVTYNSQKYISACLKSLLTTKYLPLEVLVVDNGSKDKTCDIINRDFPSVKLIQSEKNLGYAGGNNLGVKHAKGNLVAIINPDTEVSSSWLLPLVEAVKEKNIAVSQPKILLSKQRKILNLTGKTTHFLGFEWLTDYLKKDYLICKKEITSFSGSCFLIKKDIFEKLGGFDEEFFMYYEDGDLSWRLLLAGYKILLVPESIAYHDYKFTPEEDYQKAKNKFYYLERNRLVMLIKNCSTKTLIMCLPAFIFMEIGMILYFFLKGWFFEKGKTYLWILKNFNSLLEKRKEIQDNRRVLEKDIIVKFVAKVEYQELDNVVLRYCVNPLLMAYWSVVKRII